MIKIIDKIKYLKEDKKAFFDKNAILNKSFRGIVENISNKSRNINTQGYPVTIIINGEILLTDNTKITLDIDCENKEISEFVRESLR